MVYIYVLKLEGGKYYVGKSNNPRFRLENHFTSINGSAWTNLYKPIKLLKIIPNCDDYDEDKYTRIYMDKYGIDNVRGGSYVTINLDKNTFTHLQKMNNTANNKCFGCGATDHYINDCDMVNGSESDVVWVCESCEMEFDSEYDCEIHEKHCNSNNTCFRCGRDGHYASSCYASKHINGYYLKK